ncbi:uncharacterized protein EI90DRAFT_3119086 [Cantharellus anzutake]|uniref:uncharacterized protein n=1 Tax=Cantharellus anzutake TaxID=1750568 RepID=UPI001905BD9B|nr:uncharacterized protein EI90DRAFT_3119086 [Cantharellus anzutake]KAF8337642.1 hypothetical protein EI90DRAFT_3119086 [Cantharellus anzutake]
MEDQMDDSGRWSVMEWVSYPYIPNPDLTPGPFLPPPEFHLNPCLFQSPPLDLTSLPFPPGSPWLPLPISAKIPSWSPTSDFDPTLA